MGTVESPVKEIEDISFEKMPTKPTEMMVVRVPHSSLLLGRDAKGKFYAHSFHGPQGKFYYTLSDWHWTGDLMRALVRIGAITQAQADEHNAAARAAKRRNEARSVLQMTERDLERFGTKLTVAQRRKLERAAKGAD